nr:reverse transcriptase domain-containing protein [Tanacetum cinerariifolium]
LQLVANQVNGLFEARQPVIKQYLVMAKELLSIEHIKRDQNKKADALNVTKEEEDNWMIPIWEFLQLGKLPDDPQKARKLGIKASLYKLVDGKLYRRSYLSPWLRCVGAAQAKNKRYTKDHVKCTLDHNR